MASSTVSIDPEAGAAFDPTSIRGKMDTVIPMEGSEGGAGGEALLNTLDEPVFTTIKRDVKAVLWKFTYVLVPRNNTTLLYDWDLWGPLILCMLLATLLSGPEHLGSGSGSGDVSGPSFVHVFVLVWCGAAAVTLNTILLGGTLSFFQCLCALGYCLLPLNLAVIVCRIISIAGSSKPLFLVETISIAVALCWAVVASIGFVATTQPKEKKLLVIYPIFLFYFAMSILTLATINSG